MAEVPFEAECPSANMRLSEQAGAEARGVSAPTSPLHHQGSGLGAVTALGVRHHATLAEHCHMGAWARRCSQDSRPGAHGQADLAVGRCHQQPSPRATLRPTEKPGSRVSKVPSSSVP